MTASIRDRASAERELATEANEAVATDILDWASETFELIADATEDLAQAILELISMVGVAEIMLELDKFAEIMLDLDMFAEIEDATAAILELTSAETELANEAKETVSTEILDWSSDNLLLTTDPTDEVTAAMFSLASEAMYSVRIP